MYNRYFFLMLFIFLSFNVCAQNKKIFLIGLPKCGTHLIRKCLQLITGKSRLNSENRLFLNESQVEKISSSTIFVTHALYTEKNLNILKKNNFRGVFIYRDPRDQIVSMVHYIRKADIGHISDLKQKSCDELFDLCMNDYGYVFYRIWDFTYRSLGRKKITIADIYKNYLNWVSESFVYVTSFEKLVGPLGGGTSKLQYNEIKNISHHVGFDLSSEEIKIIEDNLFGNSPTFREGKIGAWKEYFTEEYKSKFKKNAGQLLINLGYEKDFCW